MQEEELTEDERKTLKELAQNLQAMSRVRRLATTTVLWFSSILVAGLFIWDWITKLGKS